MPKKVFLSRIPSRVGTKYATWAEANNGKVFISEMRAIQQVVKSGDPTTISVGVEIVYEPLNAQIKLRCVEVFAAESEHVLYNIFGLWLAHNSQSLRDVRMVKPETPSPAVNGSTKNGFVLLATFSRNGSSILTTDVQ